MVEGVFPDIWKVSSVTPIFKSGDRADVTNYRPISIISHFAKIFESLVYNSVLNSVDNILINEQHGFRPGRSTTTCNITFIDYIIDAFSKRSQVDVIYTDFTKAFDRVNHNSLLKVISSSGFGEPLLSWFASYLINRKQYIKINGTCSDLVDITSGVPQGGHLSPLLFALYVNDINKILRNCRFLLFADDIKLFLKIDSLQDCIHLQEDLECMVSWATNLGLDLNLLKCHVMTFTRRRENINFIYSVNGISLITSGESVVDLGITFDRRLCFHLHIEKITCKALKMLGFVKRTLSDFKLFNSLKTLYCSFVRSHLEYGVIVWCPNTIDDQYKIERVQRKFLKYAAYVLQIDCPPHDYSQVLHRLNLSSLADRRDQAHLLFLGKLISGGLGTPDLLQTVNFHVPVFNSLSVYPFSIPFCSSNYMLNRPIIRMMKLANEDPSFL